MSQFGDIPLASLLKRVSRSFYLSIRWLPREMRAPIALGYLLARISDTLADTSSVPVSTRVASLDAFLTAIHSGDPGSFIAQVESDFLPFQTDPDERELLSADSLKSTFDALKRLDPSNNAAVQTVLQEIVDGQRWDVSYFSKDRVVSVSDEKQLVHYTYQVAGCVGEFWTTVGLQNLGSKFATEVDRDDLLHWGREYGQGLQLVNILRDIGEDRANHRSYLPRAIESPEKAFSQWLEISRNWLQSGERYVAALNGFRIRFATALPYLIAQETLDLLDSTPMEVLLTPQAHGKVKVSRSIVRQCLIRAIWVACKS